MSSTRRRKSTSAKQSRNIAKLEAQLAEQQEQLAQQQHELANSKRQARTASAASLTYPPTAAATATTQQFDWSQTRPCCGAICICQRCRRCRLERGYTFARRLVGAVCAMMLPGYSDTNAAAKLHIAVELLRWQEYERHAQAAHDERERQEQEEHGADERNRKARVPLAALYACFRTLSATALRCLLPLRLLWHFILAFKPVYSQHNWWPLHEL